jgi:hypothetical protein
MKSLRLITLIVVAMVTTTTAFAWPACSGPAPKAATPRKKKPAVQNCPAVK